MRGCISISAAHAARVLLLISGEANSDREAQPIWTGGQSPARRRESPLVRHDHRIDGTSKSGPSAFVRQFGSPHGFFCCAAAPPIQDREIQRALEERGHTVTARSPASDFNGRQAILACYDATVTWMRRQFASLRCPRSGGVPARRAPRVIVDRRCGEFSRCGHFHDRLPYLNRQVGLPVNR